MYKVCNNYVCFEKSLSKLDFSDFSGGILSIVVFFKKLIFLKIFEIGVVLL